MKTIAFAFLFLVSAQAMSAEIAAVDCSRDAVSTALASATSGDTVTVPSGNCTWTSGLTVPTGVTMIGAGVGITNINSTGFISILLLNNSYIKGFTFLNGLARGSSGAQNWVADSCQFGNTTGTRQDVTISGLNQPEAQTGVLHKCSFHGIRLVIDGKHIGEEEWAYPDAFGGTDNVVYVEGSTFTYNGDGSGAVGDGNRGGQAVWRFNTFDDSHIQTHGSRSAGSRGFRKFEWYRNTMTRSASAVNVYGFWQRGGTGIQFDNDCSGNAERCEYLFDSERVYGDYGQCSATSGWETVPHPATSDSFMCRDVLGSGQDTNPPSPDLPAYQNDQTWSPGYIWNNTFEGGVGQWQGTNGAQNYIIEGRDYFLDDSSNASYGNGGVTTGLYANRPTCDASRANHGYWATDMGNNWNTSDEYGGADGALYRCDGAGTWNLYYTPAPYPHPLVQTSTEPDVTPPTTPGSVTATAGVAQDITLTWTSSTDDRAVTGYQIRRCTGAACTPATLVHTAAATTTSWVDGELAAETLYRYDMRAVDAAGNGSNYSSVSEATTSAAVQWTVTPSEGVLVDKGSISPSTPQLVGNGSTGQFALSIDSGYQALVRGTCGGTLAGTTYTTDAVTNDCTVIVDYLPSECYSHTEIQNVPINTSFTAQTGTIQYALSVFPRAADYDTGVGLSDNAATGWSSLAASLRLFIDGSFSARDGSIYSAENDIEYQAYQLYNIRFVVSLSTKTFDAFIASEGESEIQLADDYAFRTGTEAVTELDNFASVSWLVSSSGVAPYICLGGLFDGSPALSGLTPADGTGFPRTVIQTTIGVTTDVAATCRYSHGAATTWENMIEFGTTGSTSHSQSVATWPGLVRQSCYKCRDAELNESAASCTTYWVEPELKQPVRH